MHDEHLAARLADGAHKVAHKVVAFRFVDADAVLHGDRHLHRVHHGFHAVGHELRLGHQAGAKRAALHALGWATAVQVDLVITPLLAQFGAVRQVGRLAAAQLQRHRVLLCIELQVARHVAVNQRAGGHHFGVQQGVFTQQAVEIAAMPVRPVHHRGDGQLPAVGGN